MGWGDACELGRALFPLENMGKTRRNQFAHILGVKSAPKCMSKPKYEASLIFLVDRYRISQHQIFVLLSLVTSRELRRFVVFVDCLI